jgi:hypothetical protein
MNVTGPEWRDLDPHENKFSAGRRYRHVPKPPETDEEDVVEIQGESGEEQADGMDVLE